MTKMTRRRLVALFLAAAATAASADENNFTAASADEGRVKKFAAQSYDWLADRAPAAREFATQHGPGFVGGAITALLCMLLGGGKKAKSGAAGARRASMAEAYGVEETAAAATEAVARDAPEDEKQTRSVLRTIKDVLTFASFVLIALLQHPRVLSRANASVVDEE